MSRKYKILWFCNHRFSNDQIKTTGTWLKVMGEALAKRNDVEIINITNGLFSGEFVFERINGIQQYVIPLKITSNSYLPKAKLVNQIDNIIQEIEPDVIHVWGTESFWGLITKKHVHRFNVLLEIQGLKSQILQQFYGGLTFGNLIRCTGLKELIKPERHLFFQHHFHKRETEMEKEIIRGHNLISVQSDWSHRVVGGINNRAQFFNTLIPLREEFISAAQTWSFQSTGRIFLSVASFHSYKGLHTAIRALAVLVENNVDVNLQIAGAMSHGIRESGYERFLKQMIRKFNLESNVHWLGALDASEIVYKLLQSDVVFIPSYIESYCMVLYEALAIGIPVVCTSAGAMPEAGNLNSSIKYFQPGDYMVAASHIRDYLANDGNNPISSTVGVSLKEAVDRQITIYHQIIK